MAAQLSAQTPLNVLIIGQSGRLEYEAVLFAASLRYFNQTARLFVAEPQPGPLWPNNPRMKNPQARALLERLGATILPFENTVFGHGYPNGNKIEALTALPQNEPFVFFDTDTLLLDNLDLVPFDFDRPSASLRREDTWPKIELYGPDRTQIWKALYDHFGLDFESSLDLTQPDGFWKRYLYFNAGFFYYRCPRVFGEIFLSYARSIRDTPPPELVLQSLDPWLDQVALPLVVHRLGGGRDALAPGYLDASVSCHYRLLPLLYARETDRVVDTLEKIAEQPDVKSVLQQYDVFRFMLYHGRGRKVRALFDRENLPRKEQAIRNKIRREGFWMR
ncbi:MAG: hypothetical protein MK160_15425 [Rhodobacteraceae bacterium]|nr:hypothetical protein [Paracoccaceae bacterium]